MIPTKISIAISKLVRLTPYCVLILIAIYIWRINQLTPLWADDYCRVGNTTSIFKAAQIAYDRYLTLNGRFFVHFFNHLILGNYPNSLKYFNIINSTSFILLILVIFYLSYGRKPKGFHEAIYILLTFNLLFIATRGIGEVALWKSGSIGYLWGITLELVILVPLFLYLRGKKNPFPNRYWIWVYYLVSFAASTFIEHLSFSISAVFFYIILEHHLRGKFIPKYLKISTIIHMLGSLSLVISEGNFIKSSYQNIPSLNERILNNLSLLQPTIQGTLGWIFLLFLVLALANNTFVKYLKDSTLWLTLFLASMTFLMFVILPTEQPFIFRTAFPFETFVILAIIYLSSFLPKVAIFDITLFLILTVIAYGHGSVAYKNSLYINKQVQQRNLNIESSKKRGLSSVVVKGITFADMDYDNGSEFIFKYNYISDITKDSKNWKNSCYAKAMGLESITIQSISQE